jgi:hypothetical protein
MKTLSKHFDDDVVVVVAVVENVLNGVWCSDLAAVICR